MAADVMLLTLTDPKGRTVVLRGREWDLVCRRHPELTGHERAVGAAVTDPELHVDDPAPGHERFHRRGCGPAEWLRVSVIEDERCARVTTAFGHRFAPHR